MNCGVPFWEQQKYITCTLLISFWTNVKQEIFQYFAETYLKKIDAYKTK